jgi:RNA polymerase sigma factor (sigma-70 family)
MKRRERRAARHGWTVFIAHLHGNRPRCTLNAFARAFWHAGVVICFDLPSWLSSESPTFPTPSRTGFPLPADAADLFQSQLPLIEGVIRFIARRHRLAEPDAEEFASQVRLKLIVDDYQVLRGFRERSSLRTYLSTVVERLFLDYRIRQWGKWRPSAEARRAGELAVRLEALLHKDGVPFEEAVEVLLVTERVSSTRAEIEALRARLPHRTPRRIVGDDALGDLPVSGATAESAVLAREAAAVATRTRAALAVALNDLAPQDQIVLRLHFAEGLTIADVARALHVEQKPLYRQLERSLASLRTSLEAQGVRSEVVTEWLGCGAWDEEEAGNVLAGPSL